MCSWYLVELLAQGLWSCLVPTGSWEHKTPSSDKEMTLWLHPPWRAPVHERDTSHGAGVAEVLIGAGQGMSAIADIGLKHALFQLSYEQLAGGGGKKGALCHRAGNKGCSVSPRVILTQPASAAAVSSVTLTMHSCRVSFPVRRMGFSDTISWSNRSQDTNSSPVQWMQRLLCAVFLPLPVFCTKPHFLSLFLCSTSTTNANTHFPSSPFHLPPVLEETAAYLYC